MARERECALTRRAIVWCDRCNYAARAHGITKCDNLSAVRRKCPGIVICNGEDLTWYRHVSFRVFKLASGWAPCVERLGMDEVFLDVTAAVNKRVARLAARRGCAGAGACACACGVQGFEFPAAAAAAVAGSSGGGGGGAAVCANALRGSRRQQTRARLCVGSAIAAEIRAQILAELKLTSSAGVSTSKLLAKMVASAHKPNLQTVLVPEDAPLSALLPPHLPLGRIPGIGRASTERMKTVGVATVRDFLGATDPERPPSTPAPREASLLAGLLDAAAIARTRALCLGQDDTPVVQSKAPQTVSVEDSFWPQLLTSTGSIEATLHRLALTLMVKIRQDEQWYGPQRPSTIALAVRMHSVGRGESTKRSRRPKQQQQQQQQQQQPTTPEKGGTGAEGEPRLGRESRQEKVDARTFPPQLPPLRKQDLPASGCITAVLAGDRSIAGKIAARGVALFLKMYPAGSEFACHIVNISVRYPNGPAAGGGKGKGSMPITRFMAQAPVTREGAPTDGAASSAPAQGVGGVVPAAAAAACHPPVAASPNRGHAHGRPRGGSGVDSAGAAASPSGGAPRGAINTRGVRNYFGTRFVCRTASIQERARGHTPRRARTRKQARAVCAHAGHRHTAAWFKPTHPCVFFFGLFFAAA